MQNVRKKIILMYLISKALQNINVQISDRGKLRDIIV